MRFGGRGLGSRSVLRREVRGGEAARGWRPGCAAGKEGRLSEGR